MRSITRNYLNNNSVRETLILTLTIWHSKTVKDIRKLGALASRKRHVLNFEHLVLALHDKDVETRDDDELKDFPILFFYSFSHSSCPRLFGAFVKTNHSKCTYKRYTYTCQYVQYYAFVIAIP